MQQCVIVSDDDRDHHTPDVEEMNILYVAVTRAKRSLILSNTLARVLKESKVIEHSSDSTTFTCIYTVHVVQNLHILYYRGREFRCYLYI